VNSEGFPGARQVWKEAVLIARHLIVVAALLGVPGVGSGGVNHAKPYQTIQINIVKDMR